jgi:hypothetical protein
MKIQHKNMGPTRRNKSKIHAMNMKFGRSTERKNKRDRIKNEMSRNIGIRSQYNSLNL